MLELFLLYLIIVILSLLMYSTIKTLSTKEIVMISNKMQTLIASNSTIREMFEEGKRLASIHGIENVFDFSLGNPSVLPPQSIHQTIIEILSEQSPTQLHGYMNNAGFEDVRAALSNHLNTTYNQHLSASHLIMTCGAAGGLNVLLKTLLNPGDEVIVFAPYFTEYGNYVANFDGKLVVIPSDTSSFLPDLEALEAAITAKTKVVLINTPHNPTGVVYPKATLKALSNLLTQKEKELQTTLYLISDEPYRELVYDGVEVPYILDYYPHAFIAYSYSKSLSLPGQRIGYIVVHPNMAHVEEVIQALTIATRILGFVNAPALFQKVIAHCLDVEVDVSIYKRNRDLLYNHLLSLGIECIKPEGAFYLFPKSPLKDDRAFCELAKKHNILMVPGTAFGCPGFVRLAYCTSYEKIQRSLPAFTKLIEEIKHNKKTSS